MADPKCKLPSKNATQEEIDEYIRLRRLRRAQLKLEARAKLAPDSFKTVIPAKSRLQEVKQGLNYKEGFRP